MAALVVSVMSAVLDTVSEAFQLGFGSEHVAEDACTLATTVLDSNYGASGHTHTHTHIDCLQPTVPLLSLVHPLHSQALVLCRTWPSLPLPSRRPRTALVGCWDVHASLPLFSVFSTALLAHAHHHLAYAQARSMSMTAQCFDSWTA